MNTPESIALILTLLVGPLIFAPIERNLEVYCFGLGLIAVTLGRQWELPLVVRAATEPIMISVAVVVAGLGFGWSREYLDRIFSRMRRRLPRSILTALVIFVVALFASLITAIVAALVLVEAIGLLRFEPQTRTNVTVVGCFAIGMGAALTPIGEPLATLVASSLHLRFHGLFLLLAPYVLPGIAALSILAGIIARGDYHEAQGGVIRVHESPLAIGIEGVKIFAFIAGLVFISDAFAPVATRYLPMLSNDALYWVNMISAALDNATLAALEVHHMEPGRARELLLSLLISGGILIPGNIPNIVSAGALKIQSMAWARIGLPLGFLMLGIYFAVLKLVN